MMFRLLIVSFLLLGKVSLTFSQEYGKELSDSTKTLYLVTKNDNSEYYGYILSDDGREILMQTKSIGKIYINKSDIKEIKPLEGKTLDQLKGYQEFRDTGPYTTRYYFTNNALPIHKGENYALVHLFGPEVHFAVKEKMSIGIMATWAASPLVLALKYSLINKGKNHLAFGTLMGTSGYLNQGRGYGGLHWLTYTHGDTKTNFSVSAGYAYADFGFKNMEYGGKYKYGTTENTDEVPYNTLPGNSDASMVVGQMYTGGFKKSGAEGAIVTGLSGIFPVGQKASFIFDSMFLLGSTKNVVYHDKSVTVDYFDYNTGAQTTGTFVIGEGTVSSKLVWTKTIILMPSMRFYQSYKKAFQIALAGIVHVNRDNEVQTIPFPMISWLRQF